MAVPIEMRGTNMNFMVEVTFLLLEMLGLKEKAFVPDHSAIFSHIGGWVHSLIAGMYHSLNGFLKRNRLDAQVAKILTRDFLR